MNDQNIVLQKTDFQIENLKSSIVELKQNFQERKSNFWNLLYTYWHLIFDESSWLKLFTSIRFTLNTLGPFLVYYYFGDFKLHIAISAALVTGTISAGFQYYNCSYIRWLNAHPHKVVQGVKLYLVEIIFLFAPYLFVFAPFGIKFNSSTWIEEFQSLLIVALYTLVSQGIWDLALAYQKNLKEKKLNFSDSKLNIIYNFRYLAISFIAVSCAIIKIILPETGGFLFFSFMITGLIFYFYVWLDKRLKEISLQF